MKQTRRKELKTNELGVYLQQIYEAAVRNATYLVGGLVVVVIVLVVGLLIQRNRHRAELDAWRTYDELNATKAATDPAVLDRAVELVAQCGDQGDLGPLVLELEGRLAHEMALGLTKPADKARRMELLEQAKDAYTRLLGKFGSRPEVAARAHIALAGVEESLFVWGKGDAATVRKHYQALIEGEANPFQPIAKELVVDLDRRLAQLEVVASRPAEPPASRPAPTTRPVPTTRHTPTTRPKLSSAPAVHLKPSPVVPKPATAPGS